MAGTGSRRGRSGGGGRGSRRSPTPSSRGGRGPAGGDNINVYRSAPADISNICVRNRQRKMGLASENSCLIYYFCIEVLETWSMVNMTCNAMPNAAMPCFTFYLQMTHIANEDVKSRNLTPVFVACVLTYDTEQSVFLYYNGLNFRSCFIANCLFLSASNFSFSSSIRCSFDSFT